MPRRRRRQKGSGSIYNTKDGWCAQRERPRGEDGKRRYERRFFADKASARAQIAAWQAESVAVRRHPRAADTLLTWCQHWIVTKDGSVEATTLAFYKRHLAYANALIGDVRLHELTDDDIRTALADLTDLSPQSRKHVRTVLSMALSAAVSAGIIARNPCDDVAAPKVTKYRAYALNADELSAFFAAVAGTRLEPLWHLFADYGPRLDELLRCTWPDYDVTTGRLRIYAPKTDDVRYLTLTEAHLDRLAAWRERLALERADNPKWREFGYLFPSEVGTKLLQSNVRRAFKDALERAELPETIRIHDLRHTAATNLIAAGNDIPTVQYITGHKDSKVLLEIYAHHQEERNRAAVERVEAKRQKRG